MEPDFAEEIVAYARHLALSNGLNHAVFDFGTMEFMPEQKIGHCAVCTAREAAGCVFQNVHRNACYEALKWNGQHNYYCPSRLAFSCSTVEQGGKATYALVAGPAWIPRIGVEENPENEAPPGGVPEVAAQRMVSLSQVQHGVAHFLSGRTIQAEDFRTDSRSEILNSVFDVTNQVYGMEDMRLSVELEQKLQYMVLNTERAGVQNAVNQFLGQLYFISGAHLPQIKQRVMELTILLSRTAIGGGADVQSVFHAYQGAAAQLKQLEALDALSGFLVGICEQLVALVLDLGDLRHADILSRLNRLVHQRYAEKITLESLAQQIGVSRSYLSTILNRELGCNYNDYLHAIRVEKSKELLLNSALPLAQIAALVGFSDQSHFTRVFKQITGLPPGRYRKRRGAADAFSA